MTDKTTDKTTGDARPEGAGGDVALRASLQAFGQAVRQMTLRREVIEASAGTLFQRMLGSGSFDEVLVRAIQEVAADWLCRSANDPAAHATALLALRLLDDTYWLLLALDFLDAYFSYATLL